MRYSDVIVLAPAGWIDASIAISAVRAGARGFLDLEFAPPQAAVAALEKLARFTTSEFGVKVGPESGRFLAELPELTQPGSPLPALTGPGSPLPVLTQPGSPLPVLTQPGSPFSRLAWVILAGGAHPDLPGLVAQLRGLGKQVFLEAVSLSEARLGLELGVDGLILKGQEAGGRVGNETAFILLQRWLAETSSPGLPVYVQGGIGANTAAACVLAGATGVVLDSQVLFTRESPLSAELRQRVASLDGSETQLVGERLGAPYRVYSRPGLAVVAELLAEEDRLALAELNEAEKREAWRQTIYRLARLGGENGPWLVGQDIAFAASLGRRAGTVAGLIDQLVRSVERNLDTARRHRPLAEDSPLARQHRTRYPIVQGPMTRVSDTPAFAEAVAKAGGLPFLALALLRKAETETLLRDTRDRLGDLPWGVGILGFVPPEIRNEQMAAIRTYRPPFALIAGGRPDQSRELEKEGIPTYLHVPSPGLLRLFLKDGARRFIFEGRECGGHVGPRTSFVLWEVMIEVLLEHLGKSGKGDDLAVVFAGGIHDARSAAMVATLAAPLVERGVAIGVLMGTAYLFTHEAVEGGAIVPRFQQEALACRDTVLLQTAPGHAIRCVPTPYCDDFERERQRLLSSGRSPEETARTLEWMNIGRLRLASKGLDRAADGAPGPKLVSLSEEEQHTRGMYMIGQVATMWDTVVSVAELHDDVSRGGSELLAVKGESPVAYASGSYEPARAPCDIAIIGMACFYPGAKNVSEFWHNILGKVDAVTEVPPTHWDWRLYYDPDPRAPDKIISRWGGFLQDVPFDPLDYGITPRSVISIEPLQFFLLEAARRALTDAGYDWKADGGMGRDFPRDRTTAILGIGGGGSPLAVLYGFRTCLPLLDTVPGLGVTGETVLEKAKSLLPEWTEDSFPGMLFNVAVGRVANRFNLGGPNYAIDAACGSSLAAVHACVRELEMGTSDLAIAMGADTVQTPYAYVAFSKTHALSPKGRCRPFDAAADGIVLSEGVGAVILKRLADAERDGDRIYAVIKGMGASSDGKDKGLTAPRAEGQLRALRRAYAQAGVSPSRVELIEAHGTGTVVGDQTEARALAQIMEETGASSQCCAVGSVKSMIGHTKCAAGIAGLIKTALGVYHKTLPPTLVENPNPKGNFEKGPLYLNHEARPWIKGDGPRLAGVSAFGFGGTNFHAVLSEYDGNFLGEEPALKRWPAELFVFTGENREAIVKQIEHCRKAFQAGAHPDLPDLAASTWAAAARTAETAVARPGPMLTIIASSLDELKERLSLAAEQLKGTQDTFSDPRGVYFAAQPGEPGCVSTGSGVAFLFPGQGSQYVNMLAQLSLAFPEVRQTLDRVERLLAGKLDRPLGRLLYPGPAFSPQTEKVQREELMRADVAQPAIGACSVAILRLLLSLGIEPDYLAGHSYGEFVALHAAGVLSEDDLIRLSHRRGEVIRASTQQMPGGMVAVDIDAERTEELIKGLEGVQVANSNCPTQTVVAGSDEGLEALLTRCQQAGVRGQKLPVACAFHSPLVAPAREPLAQAINECRFGMPTRPVFSNTTAAAYPADPEAIAQTLVEHLTSPVRFREQIEAMYAQGARLFVEVGPQAVLTGFVRQTLGDRPHLAVASDIKGRSGIVQLLHLIGQLMVHGVRVRGEVLFQARGVRPFDLATLSPQTGTQKLSPTTWIINSVRSRPLEGPEPLLLGQTKALEIAQATREAAPAAERNAKQESPAPQPATTGRAGSFPERNGHVLPAAASISPGVADESAQVMLRFQDLMSRFLDTQKAVMTAYLQGGPVPEQALPELTQPGSPLPELTQPGSPLPEKTQPGSPLPELTQPGSPLPEKTQPVSPPAVEAAKQQPDRDWITGQLLELISKRTGYPREMLGLDTDLEADLGIDSIKRVEILAEMAQALNSSADNPEAQLASLEMEKLTAIGTLRGIIDYLDAGLNQSAKAVKPAATNGHIVKETPVNTDVPIQRAVVELVECPLSTSTGSLLGPGLVIFTDDGRGVAWSMAERLADLGRQTVMLRMPNSPGADGPGVYRVDLVDAQAVAEVLVRIRQDIGPIAGLVHCLPLAGTAELAVAQASWDRQARRDTRSLYLLARELEKDLRSAGKQGHAFLIAATSLGGAFGFGDEPLPADYAPGQGGVLGFLKCLGQEWPEVTVRGVDLDMESQQPSDLADCLLAEVSASEGPFEVGYHQGRRITWVPQAVALEPSEEADLLVEPGAPVLITGGARGITAEVAVELARRCQPTILLVGRSPLPGEELDDTVGLTAPAQIKQALLKRMERDGRPPSPAVVEVVYQRLMSDREIRRNLDRLRQAGATAHYYSADVRDEAAFGGLLDELQQQFGPFAGVIHGAGVIEDRLVTSKTPESFDRVFDTKVVSARILASRLKQDRLRFCVFFASLASRYGNKGQADYAAANEVLSKLAWQLDRQWQARVVAIDWGPWSQIGMVADLEKHLVQRGLRLISPEEGPGLLLDELMYGQKGDSEVVLAGGAEAIVHPVRRLDVAMR